MKKEDEDEDEGKNEDEEEHKNEEGDERGDKEMRSPPLINLSMNEHFPRF